MTTLDETVTSGIEQPTTSEAAARVQLIDAPIMSPGQCALCGKPTHPEGFAAPGLNYEDYGTFYLCGDCVGDFASIFGWLPPSKTLRLLAEVDRLTAYASELEYQITNLGAIKDAIDNFNRSNSAIGDVSHSALYESVVTPDESSNNEQSGINEELSNDIDGLLGSLTESEPNITEPITEQRPISISATRSDESSVDFTELGF